MSPHPGAEATPAGTEKEGCALSAASVTTGWRCTPHICGAETTKASDLQSLSRWGNLSARKPGAADARADRYQIVDGVTGRSGAGES